MTPRKPAPPLEAEIQKACLDWLNLQRGVKCWRQNTGAQTLVYKGKSRFIKFGVTGQLDITGIMLPGGRRIEIEVKRPKPYGKEPTDEQLAWMAMIREHGGIAFYCTSLEECIDRFQFCNLRPGVDYEDLPF